MPAQNAVKADVDTRWVGRTALIVVPTLKSQPSVSSIAVPAVDSAACIPGCARSWREIRMRVHARIRIAITTELSPRAVSQRMQPHVRNTPSSTYHW
jgi:hypothetical protein